MTTIFSNKVSSTKPANQSSRNSAERVYSTNPVTVVGVNSKPVFSRLHSNDRNAFDELLAIFAAASNESLHSSVIPTLESIANRPMHISLNCLINELVVELRETFDDAELAISMHPKIKSARDAVSAFHEHMNYRAFARMIRNYEDVLERIAPSPVANESASMYAQRTNIPLYLCESWFAAP